MESQKAIEFGDFAYGWGIVTKIDKDTFRVIYDSEEWNDYNYNGEIVYRSYTTKQTLFWDEIKFDIPKKPKIELKENKYEIDLLSNKVFTLERPGTVVNAEAFYRDDRTTAEIALRNIKSYARLLALRDQECPDSRGYEFVINKINYYIYYHYEYNSYLIGERKEIKSSNEVYFKILQDASKVCDILNSGRFNLEGE